MLSRRTLRCLLAPPLPSPFPPLPRPLIPTGLMLVSEIQGSGYRKQGTIKRCETSRKSLLAGGAVRSHVLLVLGLELGGLLLVLLPALVVHLRPLLGQVLKKTKLSKENYFRQSINTLKVCQLILIKIQPWCPSFHQDSLPSSLP